MKILCTFPGRYGDLLWALPTVRAISQVYGQPVDLVTSAKYDSLAPLLAHQPYILLAWGATNWEVAETAPMTPRMPPENYGYDVLYHLGYPAWPRPTLAQDIYDRAYEIAIRHHLHDAFDELPPLDLATPWITVPPVAFTIRSGGRPLVWVGWSEEWLELKVGILALLALRFPGVTFGWLRPWVGRYDEATGIERLGDNVVIVRADWMLTASLAARADCYLGCLSSQWVLANALGKPAIVVEPNKDRHHPVFWQDGGGRNRLVIGNDGQPTFDARHTGDVLEEVLRGSAC